MSTSVLYISIKYGKSKECILGVASQVYGEMVIFLFLQALQKYKLELVSTCNKQIAENLLYSSRLTQDTLASRMS